MLKAIALVVGLYGVGWAASTSCPQGNLTPTPITATTTPSANVFTGHAAPAVAFQAVNTAGTATVEIDMCCVGTCDPATGSWAQVAGSPMTLTVGTAVVGVANPTCQYRAYTTACTGCSVSVGFQCSGP